jgi:trimethylamine:corrinoid methyltransferase-like protein
MEFLNPDGINLIHHVVLEVLAKIGNRVMDLRARELLVEQGGKVAHDDIVFIPESAVEKAISSKEAALICRVADALPHLHTICH